MWRNDAIMHVKCGQYMALSEMWRYVVRNMKWGAVRDVVWCIMWLIWCDFNYGILAWCGIACVREVLVWYEIWIMKGKSGCWMWNVKCDCNGCYTFHISPSISHHKPHPSGTTHITPVSHHTTFLLPHGVMWNSVGAEFGDVERFAVPDVGPVVPDLS